MPSLPNYNVDDILEEVKRKRSMDSPERGGAYPPAPRGYGGYAAGPDRRELPPEPRRDYPARERDERGGWREDYPPEARRPRYDSAPPYEPEYPRRYDEAPPRRREAPPDPYREPLYREADYPEYPARERYAPERYPSPPPPRGGDERYYRRRDERDYGYDAPPPYPEDYRRESYPPPYGPPREAPRYEEPPRRAARGYEEPYAPAPEYGYDAPRRREAPVWDEPPPQSYRARAPREEYRSPAPPPMPAPRAERTPAPPVPMPASPSPPVSVKRRTPKPSMDDLLQNFGEGVGLGKGLDPKKPPVRRAAPVVGQTEQLLDSERETPMAGAPAGFPNSGAGVFSFHFSPASAGTPPSSYPPAAPPAPEYAPPLRVEEAAAPPFAPEAENAYRPEPPAPEGAVSYPNAPSFALVEESQITPPSFAAESAPPLDFSTEPEPFSPEPSAESFPSFSTSFSQPFTPEAAVSEPEPSPAFDSFSASSAVPQSFTGRFSLDFGENAAPPAVPPAPEPAAGPAPVINPRQFAPPEEEAPPVPVQPFRPGTTRVSDRQESELLHETPLSSVGNPIPLAPEDTQDDEDLEGLYHSGEEERRAVLGEVRKARVSLLTRIGLTGLAFFGLLYFGLSYLYPDVPTFPFMWAEGTTMRTFLIINVAIVALSMLINSPVIGGGLVNLCTLRADGDSLVSLAMLASVAQGVSLIISPAEADFSAGIHLYYCVPVLGLLLNLLGRLIQNRRIELGTRVACSQGDKYVMRTIKSEDFSRELSRGLPADLPEITYSVKAKYVCDFLRESYEGDYAQSLHRVLAFVALGGCLLVSILAYVLDDYGSLYKSLTVFAALLSVCAPFTTTLVSNLPMLRASGKLQKSGAAIAGYPVVEEYAEVKAATFRAKELFPEESITLCAMKVFKENQIEQAILDASSVICATDSPLAPIFSSMINANEKILKPVENIVYEDAMGLCAWVGGKRVLIGNAQLMRNHNVATPSKDYELRVAGEGKDIIYLANSGELTAMFALSYSSDPRVAAQMKELADADVSLIVHSTDPSITPRRIASLFQYPERSVKIVPANLHADYDRMTAPRERVRASVVYSGTIMSMFRALGMIPRIKACVTVGTVLEIMEMVVGYAIVTFFAFFAGMSYVPFFFLLAYQAAWAAAALIVCAVKKI